MGAKYCNQHVCMFVCLSLRSHIPKTIDPKFTKFLLRLRKGAKYCDEYVCVCVCLSVCPRGYLRNHTRDLYQIFVYVAMAVARSSSGVVAICYIVPVLWMTSCFFL